MKLSDTAKFKDIDGLLETVKKWNKEDGIAFIERVDNALRDARVGVYREHPLRDTDEDIFRAADKMWRAYRYANYTEEQNARGTWEAIQNKALLRIHNFYFYGETQPLYIGKWVDGEFAFLHMGNPKKGIVIPDPEKYLLRIHGTDYSEVSPANLTAALSAPDTPVVPLLSVKDGFSNLTPKSLSDEQKDLETQMSDLRSEMDSVKEAKSGELAQMKAEIEKMQLALQEKQRALMAELDAKKAEMEEKMEQLSNQIYLLDSQIYSILCYNGKVVKFIKLLEGKNAPDTEPLVIYQKLRYLDEELGKLASLYTIQWNNTDMFEDLLRYNPIARDTFAPNPRCVQLIRLSRTGKILGRVQTDDGLPTNMLEEYDYYHGNTVGIIIRNGENIYLGWTDEGRVHIQDDLVVDFSRTVIIPEPDKKTDDRWWESEAEKAEKAKKAQKAEVKRFIDGCISRGFVFNILQGVVDHSSILPLPSGITLAKPSEYVVYSMADGALEDNRFGGFADIIERCNADPRVGDMLLTVQNLIPERHSHSAKYQSWNNPRGRGDANRTHDASVDDCSLYPLKHIDVDPPFKKLCYKDKHSIGCWAELDRYLLETPRQYDVARWSDRYRDMTDEELKAASVEIPDVDGTLRRVLLPEPGATDLHIKETEPVLHLLISADAQTWAGTDTRVSFELYHQEYINLTFMNSIWLEYTVSSQKLGGWSIGGTAVNFAHGIRYLKTALEYVRKREVEEKALIDAIDPEICKDSNWPLALTEWKMEKRVHTMTPYQAKRFVKSMRQKETSK